MVKTVKADPRHEKIRHELLAVVRTHCADVPADQILAVAAYLVGQLIAMQDQRTMTPDAVMAFVSHNIEAGNQDAIASSLAAPGGNA